MPSLKSSYLFFVAVSSVHFLINESHFCRKDSVAQKLNSHLSSWNSNCTPHPSWAFQHWQMDSSFLPIFAIANWQESRQKHYEQTADPSQRIPIRQFLPFTRRDESLLYPSTYFSCFNLKHPLEAEKISPTAFFSTVAGHLSTEMTKQFSLEFHFKLWFYVLWNLRERRHKIRGKHFVKHKHCNCKPIWLSLQLFPKVLLWSIIQLQWVPDLLLKTLNSITN